MNTPSVLPPALGAVEFADAAVGLALLVFAVWGALRGGPRQILAVSVLAAGFWAAPFIGRLLEPTLMKTVRLGPDEAQAAAWGLGLFSAWVVGAVLVSVLGTLLAPALPASRGLGALLGIAQGALLLVLAGQIFLGATAQENATSAPALAHLDQVDSQGTRPWLERARSSLSAQGVVAGAAYLERIVALPVWMGDWVGRVEKCVEEARERRPRGR